MSRIIVFSDIHYRCGVDGLGHDPDERLAAGLAHARARVPDAERIVIMGDLAHNGDAPSYRRLRDRLASAHLPVHLMLGNMLGNHDNRAAFRAVFPETARNAGGFVQELIDVGPVRLILLETLDAHADRTARGHARRLCDARLEWLTHALDSAERPALVFMHHPPHDTGFAAMDAIKLANGAAFYDVVLRLGNVRQILCGHVHRTISGHHRGLPFAVLKSTMGQMPLDFFGTDSSAEVAEPPAFGILDIRQDYVTLQTEDF